MPAGSEADASIGFYTVVHTDSAGLTGGYLVLDRAGRPLEFHCTLPVQPSRAQEILYGPTLQPFLIGERLGQALLAKSRVRPVLLCTDQRAAAAMAESTEIPIALVGGTEDDPPGAVRFGEASLTPLGGAPRAAAFAAAVDRLAPCDIDLREPLDRIREAIREAQQSARAA